MCYFGTHPRARVKHLLILYYPLTNIFSGTRKGWPSNFGGYLSPGWCEAMWFCYFFLFYNFTCRSPIVRVGGRSFLKWMVLISEVKGTNVATLVVKNTPIYSYYESLMLVSKSHQPLFLLYLIVNFETGKYIHFIFWATPWGNQTYVNFGWKKSCSDICSRFDGNKISVPQEF